MTVVVDVGCNFYMSHPRDESVEKLRARFKPDWLYGFDPLAEPRVEKGLTVRAEAAWVFDGHIQLGIGAGGLSATVLPEKGQHGEWNRDRRVPCFNFPRWLHVAAHGWDESLVVKLDCEGAEVPLLEAVIRSGADRFVSLLLVEWHGHLFDEAWREREELIRAQLKCPVEEW